MRKVYQVSEGAPRAQGLLADHSIEEEDLTATLPSSMLKKYSETSSVAGIHLLTSSEMMMMDSWVAALDLVVIKVETRDTRATVIRAKVDVNRLMTFSETHSLDSAEVLVAASAEVSAPLEVVEV